ncbi:MAG: F0F1 ATP synthase subunit B [Lysobacteraceae bacterium]|jgi:F-type H+-transporting ATPase subunit b|uniref:F0F1 ATP synthase subunit B n=1 Tax=Denitratimonas sp. CY0512 TaxID=3131940 RepID=UPI00309D9679
MNLNLTLIAQALAFATLIWLIATLIWPPLLKAIEERQKKIAEGLAAADKSQESLAKAEEQVAELLREARTKANQIIDQANVRANQLVEQAKQEAVAEAEQQKALAQAEIESATFRAKEELRRQVADLAVAGAEKLINRQIDSTAQKALLDELAGQL